MQSLPFYLGNLVGDTDGCAEDSKQAQMDQAQMGDLIPTKSKSNEKTVHKKNLHKIITMDYYHRVYPDLLFPWILPTSKEKSQP